MRNSCKSTSCDHSTGGEGFLHLCGASGNRSFYLLIFLLAILATTFVVDCQKVSISNLYDPSDLTLASLILELNFRVSMEGLSDDQVTEHHDALMGLLCKEDPSTLIQIVEQAMAQDYVSGSANPGFSSRAAETRPMDLVRQ